MSKKNEGFGGLFESGSKMDPNDAATLAHRAVMVAAKNLTAIAYIDALNKTGQLWLRDQGMKVSFADERIIYTNRMLLWNGTPYLTVDDLGQCLALLDYYNEFEPESVLRSLRSMIWRHPQYQFTFSLAREFSPAIYFRDEQFNRLDEIELANLGTDVKADVAAYGTAGDHRLWWD